MAKKGTRYSVEFKAQTVSKIFERGCSAVEVAERLGVLNSPHRWRKADIRNPKSAAANKEKQDLAAEVTRLKKHL